MPRDIAPPATPSRTSLSPPALATVPPPPCDGRKEAGRPTSERAGGSASPRKVGGGRRRRVGVTSSFVANDLVLPVRGSNDLVLPVRGSNDLVLPVRGSNDLVLVLGSHNVVVPVPGLVLPGFGFEPANDLALQAAPPSPSPLPRPALVRFVPARLPKLKPSGERSEKETRPDNLL